MPAPVGGRAGARQRVLQAHGLHRIVLAELPLQVVAADEAAQPGDARVRAVAEAALLSVTSDLTPNGAPEGAVLSETVDVLSVTYAPGQSGAVRFKSVEALLAGLSASSNAVRIVRS